MRRGDGIYLRGHTWMLDIFHNGQRHAVRLGKLISRSVAKELAAVERAKIVKGEVGITKQRKDISFDKAVEEFLKWAVTSKRPRTAAGYKHQTRQLGKTFSGMKLSQIHPFLVEKYKQKRSGEGARIGANRELTLLKNIFNRCSQWGKYEGENPLCRVKRFDEPKRKLRFLDHEEEARLLAAAGEPLRSIMLCGIHAGLRIESEALTLRWEDIDLKAKDSDGPSGLRQEQRDSQHSYERRAEKRVRTNVCRRQPRGDDFPMLEGSQQRAGNQISSHCLYNSLQEC